MKSNAVLMVNVRGQGYAYYWLEKEPKIDDELVSSHLPAPSEGVLGPNVSFGSSRIGPEALLVTTVSGWDRRDEFGRKGLFLFHGLLFVGDVGGLDTHRICGSAVGLLRTHRMLHAPLSKALHLTARVGGQDDVAQLFQSVRQMGTVVEFDDAGACCWTERS